MEAASEPRASGSVGLNFEKRERARLSALREALFSDPGLDASHEVILRDPIRNLWPGVREDAVAYFASHRISWHQGSREAPTGHLLSSQVACVNHLFALRQRADLALAVLRGIDPDVIEPVRIGTGYVDFEYIGKRRLLNERGFARGSHCTSLDAIMAGRRENGDVRLFLIEWKYTESYGSESRYAAARSKVYDDLITASDSPFRKTKPEAFYFEPFDQLMRQTLLGWLFVKNSELGCSSFRHVLIAPGANRAFHEKLTAPDLPGRNVTEAWKSTLKEPEFYVSRTPAEFLMPLVGLWDVRSLTSYLEQRYWAGDRES